MEVLCRDFACNLDDHYRGASLGWNVYQTKQKTLEVAYIQAKITLEKDIQYRRWNANHGGVYVPITKETPPNPYLSHIPERDVTTPSGKLLTLMNPAYMTRQVNEMEQTRWAMKYQLTASKDMPNYLDLIYVDGLRAVKPEAVRIIR